MYNIHVFFLHCHEMLLLFVGGIDLGSRVALALPIFFAHTSTFFKICEIPTSTDLFTFTLLVATLPVTISTMSSGSSPDEKGSIHD